MRLILIVWQTIRTQNAQVELKLASVRDDSNTLIIMQLSILWIVGAGVSLYNQQFHVVKRAGVFLSSSMKHNL